MLALLEQQIAELGGEEAQRVEATRLLRPERPQCRLVPAPERLLHRRGEEARQLGRLVERSVLAREARRDVLAVARARLRVLARLGVAQLLERRLGADELVPVERRKDQAAVIQLDLVRRLLALRPAQLRGPVAARLML